MACACLPAAPVNPDAPSAARRALISDCLIETPVLLDRVGLSLAQQGAERLDSIRGGATVGGREVGT
ncbi:hypothetical protein O159_25190 [Leifsonia xyli subsp. cynodontis DSM 46306]|uniref:Uncharacterized protein n=1 Tax=Leifsonia xyli subsp. cynodontis DSM 46306 TaxID=1389489 RepID=U3PCH7_LEIXC|nr:hypothetical protein O159_25190 [Leifsonia xyli subsp. cynodontis DSM 46306]